MTTETNPRQSIDKVIIEAQLNNTYKGILLDKDEQGKLGDKISGKVRDCFVVGDKRILVTSDRISAFDRVLTTIPFKGQILNQLAAYWFSATSHIIDNHILYHPHPYVLVSQEAKMLPVELVVRGYLAGSAWRDYQAGRDVSGITLAKGLGKSEKFETPIITPTTKALPGAHDQPISSTDIVKKGLVEESVWEEACDKAIKLFNFASQKADKNNLILVDSKYEFGLVTDANGKQKLIIADEIHTPDSSRYWIKSSYESAYASGDDPIMLDKEFVRRWLIARGYMGEGTAPEFPDAFRVDVAQRYIDAFEQISGGSFYPKTGPLDEEIKSAVFEALSQL